MTGGHEFAVRECRADEVEALLELWRGAGSAPSATDTPVAVVGLLERADGWLLVAESGGRIVGSLIATWDGWRGSFYKLAVAPELRRCGIATALVREGEERLRRAGAHRLSAIVLPERPDAAGFWEAAGFDLHDGAVRFTKTC